MCLPETNTTEHHVVHFRISYAEPHGEFADEAEMHVGLTSQGAAARFLATLLDVIAADADEVKVTAVDEEEVA